MIVVTLVVAGIFLLIANRRSFRPRTSGEISAGRSVSSTIGLGIGGFIVSMGCLIPVIAFQAIGLVIARIVCAYAPGAYRFATFGVTLFAFWLAFDLFSYPVLVTESRLRAAYPFESMEARVPTPQETERAMDLPAATAIRLGLLNNDIEDANGRSRQWMLKRLHEGTTSLFASSPGFGAVRMIRPSNYNLTAGYYTSDEAPNQPGTRSLRGNRFEESVGQILPDDDPLHVFHRGNTVEFAFAPGFGYVKDRKAVAGFLSHRFTLLPKNPGPWKLQSLELMGLVLHPEPVIYVSDRLPRMDQLNGISTRSLDLFESEGLGRIRSGEDLYVREWPESMRMIGRTPRRQVMRGVSRLQHRRLARCIFLLDASGQIDLPTMTSCQRR